MSTLVRGSQSFFILPVKSTTTTQHMNCWHCGHELIWGGDHDTEDNEDYDIVSNLSCPECHAAVDVWHPSEKLIEEYKEYDRSNEMGNTSSTTKK